MSVFKAFFGLGKIPKVTKYFEFPSFDDVNKMGGAIQAMKTEARITGKKFSPAQKKYLDDQMKQVEIVFEQIKQAPTKSPLSGIRNTEPAKIFDLQGKEIPKGSKIMGGKAVKETEAEIAARLSKENKMSVGRFRKKKMREEVSKVNDQIEERIESGVDEMDPELAKLYDKQNDLELRLDFEDMIDPDPTDFADGGVAGLLGERPGFKGGYLASGAKELGKKYKGSTLSAILKNPKLLGAELGHDGIMELMRLLPNLFAQGGPARQNFAMGKRAFLKLLAGTGAGIAGLKSGLLGFGKGAGKKAVSETVKQAAGSGTPPPYFFKLVDKIKTLGDDVTKKSATQEREVVTRYKDFELTENIVTGEKTIQRMKIDNDLKYNASEYYGKPVGEETYMNYRPGKGQIDETTKGKTPPDEYTEDTSLIRSDKAAKGKVMDTFDGVPDDILEEVGETIVKKADGGRIGFSAGKRVGVGLMNLINKKFGKGTMTTAEKLKRPKKALDREMFKKADKRLSDKKMLDDDKYQDFLDEIGGSDQLEAYNFDGTVGSAKRILKEQKQYVDNMFMEYKKGNLDPVAGDKSPARKRFLQNKLDEAEASGDNRLITRDEIEELSTFDLGTQMDDIKMSPKNQLRRDIKEGVADVMKDTSEAGLARSIEVDNIKLEFPGISDDMINNILTDTNPQRIAEVKQTMREALKMQEKGMGPNQIIDIFKNTKRTKQATGGRIGFSGGGGLLKLFKLLKPKPKKLETVKSFLDRRQFMKDMVGNTEKNRKARQLAEIKEAMEKARKEGGYKFKDVDVDKDIRPIFDKEIAKSLKKDRKLNATGGLANMLGE